MRVRSSLSFLILILLAPLFSFAQDWGVLPFTGIRYFNEGLKASKIELTLDDLTWTSNRIPVDKDFKLVLKEPTGFKKDAEGQAFPGLEVLILSATRDTVGYAPNLYEEGVGIGMNELALKSLKLTLGFPPPAKAGDRYTVYMNFFDQKGTGKLRMIFPVEIVSSSAPLDNSASISSIQSYTGYQAMATGVQHGKPETYLDSTYYPKSLYHSIRFPDIQSLTPEEGRAGRYKVWLYDAKGEERTPVKAVGHYIAATNPRDKDHVNILVQVPLAPDEAQNKKYLVRYRWESADGKKVVEMVNRFSGK